MARVVAMAGSPSHLDVDGIALGLIGALEVLWQGIAFQSEADIDREAARRQSLGFLRSVFPGEFGGGGVGAGGSADAAGGAGPGGGGSASGGGIAGAGAVPALMARLAIAGVVGGGSYWTQGSAVSDLPRHLAAGAYSDGVLLTTERERLFRPAWQVVGHEAEVAGVGDFLTGDLAGERALVVRDAKGLLHAFRNACRRRPHALVAARTGHFSGVIPCAAHGLEYGSMGGCFMAGLLGIWRRWKSRRRVG